MQEVTVWNGKPRWMWCWDFHDVIALVQTDMHLMVYPCSCVRVVMNL